MRNQAMLQRMLEDRLGRKQNVKKRKTMNTIDAGSAKLAGLQIDTLTKYRAGKITLDQWERFNGLSFEDREERFGDWKKPAFAPAEQTKIPSLILKIDRTRTFNSADTFPGLTIWKGTENSFDPEGQDDQDSRSLALVEVDFAKVDFTHHLIGEEAYITGEVALVRAKEGGEIRLDPAIGEALWLDYKARGKSSVLQAIFQTKKITWFELLTPLRDSYGSRCALCFCRRGGRWDWDYGWLSSNGYGRGADRVSASLAS